MRLDTLISRNQNKRRQILQIVGECLEFSKEQMTAYYHDITLTTPQMARINRAISKLRSGVPLSYCTHKKWFYNTSWKVNKDVLIPRYETEILVENAIAFANKLESGNVVDVGTGSGNIIISISKVVEKHLKYFAVDKSAKALAVAKTNAKRNKITNIKFYKSDLLSNPRIPKQFDLIVANLPYLRSDYLLSLPENITKDLKFEPREALDGGRDGLKIIRELIGLLDTRMRDKGAAILEIGDDQRGDVVQLCKRVGLKTRMIKDLNGFDRFIVIKKRTR